MSAVHANIENVSRRGFLKGLFATGGLVVAAEFIPSGGAFAAYATGAAKMAGGVVSDPHVFVSIDPSGLVTIVAHRAEMGTGSRTSLPMAVADELEADWARVKIVQSPGDEKKYGAYNLEHLAFVSPDSSAAPTRVKAVEDLDRGVSGLRFAGESLFATVTDDRSAYPISITRNAVTRLLNPPIAVSNLSMAGGHTVLLSGNDTKPTEIYVLEAKGLRQITHQNDALMNELQVGQTEELSFKSKDGTEVHGLLTYPAGYVKGTKVPLLLRIHGGPNGQDAHSFSIERQVFAANGYAVLAVNYRGSSGRGQKYSRSIFADWGHYEVEDLEAGVDHVIAMGVADPDRLGAGGWSYGGILTAYMIATDTRFKGATSGAGTAFAVAFYGWKAFDTYMKLSYPFLHADRIKTPTLFLGGERDFNVPVQGGQQMYQALRSLGIETQLVIYPNEFHGISRPSYVKDRYERYLAWYDKYVKNPQAPKKNVAETGTR